MSIWLIRKNTEESGWKPKSGPHDTSYQTNEKKRRESGKQRRKTAVKKGYEWSSLVNGMYLIYV